MLTTPGISPQRIFSVNITPTRHAIECLPLDSRIERFFSMIRNIFYRVRKLNGTRVFGCDARKWRIVSYQRAPAVIPSGR
jgi:hypothetical protein